MTAIVAPGFDRAIDADLAAPGRLHIYGSWSSPGSHRAAIVRALLDVESAVSMSYVDGRRDALLHEVYRRSQPGYDGPVRVPVLWDRCESRIVSNAADRIDLGLASIFGGGLYPADRQAEIDEILLWIEHNITSQLRRSVYEERARAELLAAFHSVSTRVSRRPFLVGGAVTLADIRLWVSLVRYDAGPNAHNAIGPKLSSFDALWAYARRLYRLPAFRSTTRLHEIAAPFAALPDWES